MFFLLSNDKAEGIKGWLKGKRKEKIEKGKNTARCKNVKELNMGENEKNRLAVPLVLTLAQ